MAKTKTIEDGRLYDKKTIAEIRRRWIDGPFADWILRVFAMNPKVQSAMFCLSSYYNDEASDALHYQLLLWAVATPGARPEHGEDWDDYEEYASLPTAEKDKLVKDGKMPFLRRSINWADTPGSWDRGLFWEDNGEAIDLLAPFAVLTSEGSEYEPYLTCVRTATGIEISAVEKMIRPELDGMCCEWEQDEEIAARGDKLGVSKMLGAYNLDDKTAKKWTALGIPMWTPKLDESVSPLHMPDPWAVRALGVVNNIEVVAQAMKDPVVRSRIDAMMKLGVVTKT